MCAASITVTSRRWPGATTKRNGGMTGALEWWDASQFKPLATHPVGQYVRGAVASPDARYLAAADWQGRLSLLETAGGRTAGEFDASDVRSSALAFSPDGRRLAFPALRAGQTVQQNRGGPVAAPPPETPTSRVSA